MKKKILALIMCLCMAFVFTACGSDSATEETKAEATAEATNSDAEATEGFTKTSQGEKLTFDWGEFTVGNFGHGECLVSKSDVKYKPSNDNYYVWLPLEFKNTSTDPIELDGWWMLCNFVMNDEYNYEGDAKQIDGDWTIQPLETRTLYVTAEVPKEVAESYETITAQFAFNDEFHDYDVFDDEITDLDNVYEAKASK